jgi:hypothetical protein
MKWLMKFRREKDQQSKLAQRVFQIDFLNNLEELIYQIIREVMMMIMRISYNKFLVMKSLKTQGRFIVKFYSYYWLSDILILLVIYIELFLEVRTQGKSILIYWLSDILIYWLSDNLIYWLSDILICWLSDILICWLSDNLIYWLLFIDCSSNPIYIDC